MQTFGQTSGANAVSQGYSQGYLAPAAATPPSSTVSVEISRLQGLVSELVLVAGASERIADAIQGSRGNAIGEGKAGPSPVPNGCIEMLDAVAAALGQQIARIDMANKRSTQALGLD